MNNTTVIKRWIFVAIAGLIIVFGLVWFAGHSYIEIARADNSAVGNVSYTLMSKSGTKSDFTSSDKVIKKRVAKGSYEILATQDSKSYVAIVQTQSFLHTSSVKTNLSPEVTRSFVANSPSPCMYYLGGQLASIECGDDYKNLKLHLPATASQPSYISAIPGNTISGNSEGIVSTKQGSVALVKTLVEGDFIYEHVAYQLGDNFLPIRSRVLSELQASDTYKMIPYKDGFIAYNPSLQNIYYYSSVEATGQRLSLQAPKDTTFEPFALTSRDDTLVIAYAKNGTEGAVDSDSTKGDTDILAYSNGRQSHFIFHKKYSSATSCSPNKLCLLGGNSLDVYDLATSKPKLLYSIPNVNDIQNSNYGLLVVSDRGILRFDTERQEGYAEYSFGSYKYCGLQSAANGYILCIISPKGGKTALYIDQQVSDTTAGIDKKILLVETSPAITSASVYRNFIFVTPNYGEQVYVPSLNIYGYSPETLKSVNQAVASAIEKAGIDQKVYTVVNTGIIQ